MSSRQEEKEQRRKEREERERIAAAKAKRQRLLQLVGGVVVACAVIAGVVVAVASGGSDGDDDAGIDGDRLRAAANEAGCVYRSFPEQGRDHVSERLTPREFRSNPPTSGPHNPEPAPDGLYVAGNEPAIENWVHTLEHGRVIFQYRPGLDAAAVAQLQRLFNEDVDDSGGAYHSVLMRNNTEMPFAVAAVAWRHYMGCRELTPQAIEALRTFRVELVDKGPETVP